MKILLVEDEVRMADAVRDLLLAENYVVDVCHEGTSGLDALLTGIYDLAILDMMLPGLDGRAILENARHQKILCPILMLTARSETADKVSCLDAGADDYLTKPFEVDELLARVRALTRRGASRDIVDNEMTYADLSLNRSTGMLRCLSTGREIRLPEKEYHIMEYLLANVGQLVSKDQLALKIWGYESEAEYNNVEVYISFTRKKMHFLGTSVEIKAVRGMGYELRG